MSVAILPLATIKSNLVAAIRASLQAVLPGGTPIPPTFAAGDPLDALTNAQGLVELYFQGQLDYVQKATTPGTATGQDLKNLVALLYTVPDPAYALKPVLFGQNVADGTTQTVPVGLTMWGRDSTGRLTIGYTPQQDPTQAIGVAATKPAGVAGAWAICKAISAGSNANLPAGSFGPGSLGGALPWCDYVADPAVPTPNLPTLTAPTTGGTLGPGTYLYRVLALGVPVNGVAGTTLPTGSASITVGSGTTNSVVVAWTMPTSGDSPTAASATGFVVEKYNSVSAAWEQLGTTMAGTLTLTDTGQATTAYPNPLSNTTNAGVGGVDALTDAQIRTNAANALAKNAGGSAAAILAAVLEVNGVQNAFLQDAGVNGQAAGTFAAYFVPTVAPASPTLTAAVQAAVNAEQGEGIIGTAMALAPVPVAIAYTFTVAAGTSGAALIPQTDSAILAYIAGLGMGDPLRGSGVSAAIYSVPGVIGVTALTLTRSSDSSVYSGFADVPGVTNTIYSAGARTPTTA